MARRKQSCAGFNLGDFEDVDLAVARLKPRRVFELLDRRGWIRRRNSQEIGKRGAWMTTVHGQGRGYVEHAMGAVDVAGRVVETRQLVITPGGQRIFEAELAQGRLDLRRPRKD